jgi:hypothetical protein
LLGGGRLADLFTLKITYFLRVRRNTCSRNEASCDKGYYLFGKYHRCKDSNFFSKKQPFTKKKTLSTPNSIAYSHSLPLTDSALGAYHNFVVDFEKNS